MPLADTAIRAVESLDKPQKLFDENDLFSAWKKPESRQLSILPPPFRLKQGIFLFPSGVRSIWLHYNLAYMKQRLTALGKQGAISPPFAREPASRRKLLCKKASA